MGEITGKATQNKKRADDVSTECVVYEDMKEHWPLIHALLGGTPAMRDGAEVWLPPEPEERPTAYAVRLGRSFLHPAYADTVETITSKPFVRPVSIQGDLPEQLSDLEDNINGTGQNLTQFAREVFNNLVNYGLAHVLVDYTQVPDPEDTTMADEKAIGARPRFVNVSPVDLFAFLLDEGSGTPELAQIRYRETRIIRDGAFADKKVDTIRVYGKKDWQIWEKKVKNGKETYTLVEEGTHTFGRVPLVTCYINRTGFMTGLPPLDDLAWLNLAHWQSMSDQRNILRYARVALLFGSGFTQEEIDAGIIVGPDRLIGSTNTNAKLQYVEHSGRAIEAGEKDLEKTEERMEILGMQPFIRNTGNATATGRAIDEGKRQSNVQAWIRSLENVLTDAFRFAGEWAKVQIPEDFKVDIFSEFGLSIKASADVDALIRMRQTGEITRETFLREIKRRGVLSETVDVEVETAAIEAEGPALGMVGVPGDGEEGEEE